MRRLLVLGVVVVGLVIAIPLGAVMTTRNAVTPSVCGDDGVSQPFTGSVPPVAGLSAPQVRLAQVIWSRARANEARLRGPADQAAVIAIAVALQESALGANPAIAQPNADGDAGPFQQRQRPGWYGTLTQVTNPGYTADTFLLGHTVTTAQYAAAVAAGSPPAGPPGYHLPGLADVAGWAQMDIIEAADRVQRSAFPDAVADDIPVARKLVAAFAAAGAGRTVDAAMLSAVSSTPECESSPSTGACPPSGSPAEHGVKPDTLLVLRCVKQAFPKVRTFYGYRPHDPYPDHPSGRAVDIMVSSAFANYGSTDAIAYGTRLAEWVKAHRKQLGVQYIIWRQHIWNIERPGDGWRQMADRGNPTANHMDHVHVTTFGDRAEAEVTGPPAAAGTAVAPVDHYRISARFGDVGTWARYHTGLDFAAPIGTPVHAALGGMVTHAGYGPAAPWAGDYVTIRHADGTSTLYAHMARHQVSEGQVVVTGQQVGAIGVTGRSFGPHLHFEVYPRRVPPGDIYRATDPTLWLRQHGRL